MYDFLRPTEFLSVLDKIRNAKSIEEFENSDLKDEMFRMYKTIKNARENKQVPEMESKEIFTAFLASDPGAVLQRLVELRSRSVSDQTSSAAKVVDIDIEDTQLHFSLVYRYFFSMVLYTINKEKCICFHFLRSNAIKFILRELQSSTFRNYKRKSPSKSQTALVIDIHLGIIYNISIDGIFKYELHKQLENGNYFRVLEFYVIDRSVPCLTAFFTSDPGIFFLHVY